MPGRSPSNGTLLVDLPGIGRAFRHESDLTERRETIIFLTPHIVDGGQNLAWDQYQPKEIRDIRE